MTVSIPTVQYFYEWLPILFVLCMEPIYHYNNTILFDKIPSNFAVFCSPSSVVTYCRSVIYKGGFIMLLAVRNCEVSKLLQT